LVMIKRSLKNLFQKNIKVKKGGWNYV